MSKLTANQHYVWQYHLRAWATPKKLWCKRHDQPEPFSTTPRNVASERYFYEFQELLPVDLAYIEQLIDRSGDTGLREANRGWVTFFQRTFVIRRALADRTIAVPLKAQLETELRNIERMLGETYHQGIEGRTVPLLDALRRQDASFHDDEGQCATFIQFLTLQYFRTAKLRNDMLAIANPLPHDMARTWPIEAFIYATNVGASLYRQRRSYRLLFLPNETDIPFITGDQPIINLIGIETEELDFYYPLSPKLAMIYTATPERYPGAGRPTSRFQVEHYNFRMFARSDAQIYGNDPAYLKAVAALPKSSDWSG
nr:DUF4238 domain-containing protein [Sphingomonas sp. Y57]